MSSPLPPKPPEPQEREEESLLGAQAAAQYLGLHRSTLFLAVQQGALIPDARTRGRHTRFRRATLDAFRARYSVSSATGETALAPLLRVVSELAQICANANALEVAVKAAAERVQRALPGVDGVSVAKSGVLPGDPYSVEVLTEPAVPADVQRNFERLRHTFRFGTTTALRTLEEEISEDTSSESTYTGTRSIVRIWTMGAYAIYPIVVQGEARGLLFCTCSEPRRFSASDRAFLRAVVAVLALAFERSVALDALHAADAAEALVAHALALRVGAPLTQSETLASLADRYLKLSDATTLCTRGLSDDLACDGRLVELVARVRMDELGAHPQIERWEEGGEWQWGMALSVGQLSRQRIALGATWRRSEAPNAHNERLLRAFGAALLSNAPSEAGVTPNL